MKKLTTEKFREKASKIHNNRYDYSKSIYETAHIPIVITCKIHGDFYQTPNNHIYCQKGCSACAQNKKYTTNEFIQKATKIHNAAYDYSLVVYTGCFDRVTIICPKHGKFIQAPSEHLYGKGCIKCTHIISNAEQEFLDYCSIPIRNFRPVGWTKKPVDGYDPTANTIYEFLGDYWHGNPSKYDSNKLHPKRKVTYGTLYNITISSLTRLKSLGYQVKYIWENDWNKFRGGLTTYPNILTL